MLNKEEIKKIIPQREPFLMIDEVEEFVPGEMAIAYKNVDENEWYFKGHFPGNPIMPGVLIAESLAQAGAVAILSQEENIGKNALFGGIDKMKFKKMVVPGDKLKLEVKIIKKKGPIGVGEGTATVNRKASCQRWIYICRYRLKKEVILIEQNINCKSWRNSCSYN